MKIHQKQQSSVVTDIVNMHKQYGFHEKVDELSSSDLFTLLQFRLAFLTEELNETKNASSLINFDPEEIVDGLIDLMVVAIGTLDLFEINTQEAWDKVHIANMNKEVGIKEGRPNPLGLPDLKKPERWTAPCHEGNYGRLPQIKEFTNSK